MRASAIIVKKNKILLIHRFKKGKEYWVFPGGNIEEGEKKIEAIKREVLEETSLAVTSCRYSFDYKDEDGECNPVFTCEVEGGEPRLAEGAPEAEAATDTNWYKPEWIDIEGSLKLKIYPEEGIRVIRSLLRK
ncbi:NUDIX domain-containing protein [Candidatus Woesebacteria bacterium]|nr:NUDIX domain-containing protein [Candidatus Woesebacteria bacterium]